jgi:predicted ATP-binding protein involved in virulence
MELVYLWVEEYKNIKNQGFKFSPRFECEFKAEYEKDANGKKKLKDNCELEIIPTKDFVSIFPDNINVTAIVGENGSGKTNTITLLMKSLFLTNKKEFQFKYLLVYMQDKSLIYYSNFEVKCNIEKVDNIQKLRNNFHLLMSFAPGQIDIFNEVADKLNKTYKANYSIEPSRRYQSSGGAGITTQIEPASFVSTLTINAIPFYKYVNNNILKNLNLSQLTKLRITGLSGIGTEVKMRNFDDLSKINFFGEEFKQRLQYVLNELDNNKTNNSTIQQEIDLVSEKIKFNKNDKDLKEKLINLQKARSKFLREINKILKDAIKNQKDFLIKDFYNNDTLADIEILNLYYSFEIIDNSDIFNYATFSTGQQVMIAYIGLIYRFMNKAQKSRKNSFTIIIDEVETSLHPNWQAKFFNFLIEILKTSEMANNFKTINIIISSHSPFVLSDIPKENVIFLEKYKEEEDYDELKDNIQKVGNCKNKTQKVNIERTFGANIHTLLSDGFFMSDGLMGEFAKSKITEILDFLNDKEELKTIKKEQIKPIIESIGEDFLRNKLFNLYHKKLTENEKETEKSILKNKIDELQKQYDELNK